MSILYREDHYLYLDIINTCSEFYRSGDSPQIDTRRVAKALMKKYDMKLRPEPVRLRLECYECKGLGKFVMPKRDEKGKQNFTHIESDKCQQCAGKGFIESDY